LKEFASAAAAKKAKENDPGIVKGKKTGALCEEKQKCGEKLKGREEEVREGERGKGSKKQKSVSERSCEQAHNLLSLCYSQA